MRPDNTWVDAPVPLNLILRHVLEYFDLTHDELCSKLRPRDLVGPRWIFMYLAREMTDVSLVRVGKVLGGMDHTTVRHGHLKISEFITLAPPLPTAGNSWRTGGTDEELAARHVRESAAERIRVEAQRGELVRRQVAELKTGILSDNERLQVSGLKARILADSERLEQIMAFTPQPEGSWLRVPIGSTGPA